MVCGERTHKAIEKATEDVLAQVRLLLAPEHKTLPDSYQRIDLIESFGFVIHL
jgi:hypothetical protein